MRGSRADFTGEAERQARRYAVALKCKHPNAEVGRSCYDYCPDCGAVRSGRKPGQEAGPWYVSEAGAL